MLFSAAKPGFWTVSRLAKQVLSQRSGLFRVSLAVILLGVLVYGVFRGTLWTLAIIQETLTLAFLPPSSIIGTIFVPVFVFLVIANLIEALGSLFLSRSLETIIKSPLPPFSLFIAKTVEIGVSSSWMVVLFVSPIIFGFWVFHHGDFWFFLHALLVFLPFLALAVWTAMLIAILFASFFPANRTREVFIILGIGLVFGFLLFLRVLAPEKAGGLFSVENIFLVLDQLARPDLLISPPYWAGVALGERLQSSGQEVNQFFAILYIAAICLGALTFLLFRTLHFAAFSKAQSLKQGVSINSRASQRRWAALIGDRYSAARGVIVKDYKVFFRDLAQASQSLMLLGIAAFYVAGIQLIYRFNVMLPGWEAKSWGQFLMLISAMTEAFIITAVCSRFVFPSVSLEGESFWVLQTSPQSIKSIMRYKFWGWFIPVATTCSLVFCVGTRSIGAPWAIVILKALATVVVCFGMVGLAIGFGSRFANFKWEHSAQLSAGFGNMVFMLTGVLFISVSLFFMWVPILLVYSNVHIRHEQFWLIVTLFCYTLLFVLNIAFKDIALNYGERELLRRMEHD
ncbi:hypothetical protein JNK13_10930 [bacterium]|nr:hypothetical protein [bacterium]